MKRISFLILLYIMLFTGCGTKSEPSATVDDPAEQAQSVPPNEVEEDAGMERIADVEGIVDVPETVDVEIQEDLPEILNFVDVFGEEYQVEILPEVEKHTYQSELFVHDGNRLSYDGDPNYTYRLGVDVSHHQGTIDWQAVKDAGMDFAFLRIGYRGYGKTGVIKIDTEFVNNITNAQKAGIDVGVYFFSQAINEEEAKEEAEFVLKNLKDHELQLPVVYDPESILDAEARTDDVTGEQFTKNTIMFCDLIKEAGFEPMIYSNMLWEAYEFDLGKLSEYPIWYADYELEPQTPYHFEFWQYSNTGKIAGITGKVDLDIQLIPAN